MLSGKFLRRLRKGKDGIRLHMPRSTKVLENLPAGALAWDAEHKVMWQIGLYPFGLDLDPSNDEVLNEDIERAARHVFEEEWKEFQKAPTEIWQDEEELPEEILHPTEPRTADPEWTPVIEAQRTEVSSVPALKVIFRSAYRAGCETVVGQVLIPVEGGMFEIAAIHQDDFTGMREALLTDRLLKERMPDFENPDEFPLFTQSEIDDPKHDSLVPEHCLTCVRSAMAWFFDTEASGFEVLSPAEKPHAGEQIAPRTRARITLPPRFTLSPATDSLHLHGGIDLYTRCSMPDVDVRLLDVWWQPDVRVTDQDGLGRLEEIARQNAEGWADEGAIDIRVETRPLPETGLAKQVSSYIRYSVASGPTHTLARWLAFPDGRVYRIAVSGPLFVSRDELASCADTVASSFQPMDLGVDRVEDPS